MALYTTAYFLEKGAERQSRLQKSLLEAKQEEGFFKAASEEFTTEFDIFLSHSYDDKKYIGGVVEELKEFGYEVYVDWMIDKWLDRTHVNSDTATILKVRMRHSRCLFFATSVVARKSIWMPWELGYMDGRKNRVAILPMLQERGGGDNYHGQEYLGMYPYIVKTKIENTDRYALWISKSSSNYVELPNWLKGENPYER